MYDRPSRYSARASPRRACCRRDDMSTCGSFVSRMVPAFCKGSVPVAKTQNQSTASDVPRRNAREFISISFEPQGPETRVQKTSSPLLAMRLQGPTFTAIELCGNATQHTVSTRVGHEAKQVK